MYTVNGDLVAAEARYHRKKGCLSHYISERNIKALQSTPKKCELTTACEILKEEYKSTIEDQLIDSPLNSHI